MSQEMLDQADDGLGIIDKEGPSTDPRLAKKIENAFFEISRDNVELQKIMRDNKNPSNLNNLKTSKNKPGN